MALSSTEAEYMALTEASKEAIHLRRLLEDLGYGKLCDSPTLILCDSQGANELMRNPVHHSRTKHIDIRHHFVRDAFQRGLIDVDYLPSSHMPADVLTKAISGELHRRCANGLGLSARSQ